MTPQEQQLVSELFARLVQVESAPRDPEAERLIADGIKKAPNAAYALVQTTLVQDEALKRADARIQELQAQLDNAEQPQRQQGGFLDSMRDALFGRNEPHASVPTAQRQAAQYGSPGNPGAEQQPGFSAPRAAAGPAGQPSFPAGPTFGSGGSFLGTAASVATGVIGGGLLRDGIRSMFGHSSGYGAGEGRLDSAFRSNLGGNNVSRQVGDDDIGQNHIDQDDAATEDFETGDTDDDGNFADDDTYDA